MPKSILVVEDDFDTLYPLAELLRLRGYSVVTASNAEEALGAARARLPDLIITDIVLPGKSGLHVIQTVRTESELRATPIIVISGCGPMILVEAESAGADICLEKPIRIDEFWWAVEVTLGPAAGEPPAGATQPTDPAPTNEIDKLVEELRACSTRPERDRALARLKEAILKRSRRAGGA